jgi:aminocarboxymuconate-semialdehyde decarboxylase
MKIDVFNHIVTPRYNKARRALGTPMMRLDEQQAAMPALFDLDMRFRSMDTAGNGYVQIINTANPPVENIGNPVQALELARIANDEMAELVSKHPDRFIAAAACVPMNDIDAAIREFDRAVRELSFRAVQIYTDVQGVPLDDAKFEPLFAHAAALDVPILMHPVRGPERADYPVDPKSRFDAWRIIGWLYDTVAAMSRIAFSGIFDRHPDIKIVTHHLGGFAPYAGERIREGYDKFVKAAQISKEPLPVQRHPYEYFRQFYADTITIGSVSALLCGIDFFGVDRLMFGTDMPFDTVGGVKYIDVALKAINALDISPHEKALMFELNARRLFHL